MYIKRIILFITKNININIINISAEEK